MNRAHALQHPQAKPVPPDAIASRPHALAPAGSRRAYTALAMLLVAVGCGRSHVGSARQSGAGEVTQAPAPRPQGDSFRRLEQEEVTPTLEARAKQFLDAHSGSELGTQNDFTVDGKRYRAILEEHYHAPGEPGPDGPHKGVTLYVRE